MSMSAYAFEMTILSYKFHHIHNTNQEKIYLLRFLIYSDVKEGTLPTKLKISP